MAKRGNRRESLVTMGMVKLYIEGGGDQKRLKSECRRAFAKFFEKAGFKGNMPRIVACGGRQGAYDDFCIAVRNRHEVKAISGF